MQFVWKTFIFLTPSDSSILAKKVLYRLIYDNEKSGAFFVYFSIFIQVDIEKFEERAFGLQIFKKDFFSITFISEGGFILSSRA